MLKLFYSYCHKDEHFRENVEMCLSLLKDEGLIDEWHDRKISAGQEIDEEIEVHLETSDIVLLLISGDFLASQECQVEVKKSMSLRNSGQAVVVPVILRPCAWLHHREISSLLALPTDGKPVTKWDNQDDAFLDIYEGVADALRKIPFSLRNSARDELTEIEFIAQGKEDARLDDVFVFPNLVREKDLVRSNQRTAATVKDLTELWTVGSHIVLRGDDKSGKTVVCRKLFLDRVDQDAPVLLLHGSEIVRRANYENVIMAKFREQFTGEYRYWKNRERKTLIVDDFANSLPLQFIDFAKDHFDTIVISVSEDEYISYFSDESKLASFELLAIQPLNHVQQEQLIKNWKTLGAPNSASLSHGVIDQIEDSVNSIVIHKAIVPRYAFYVLSILQLYEAFMPQGLQITAYGHCYQSLITANLSRSGIHGEDVDSALNFLSCLAFEIFREGSGVLSAECFAEYLVSYRGKYLVKDGVVNRVTSQARSIIRHKDGEHSFRYPFACYYFLGHYLARNYESCKGVIESLVDRGHVRENALTLIFVVHHAQDDAMVNLLISRTMGVLGETGAATLSPEETRLLETALEELPRQLVTDGSVEAGRVAERRRRDRLEGQVSEEDTGDGGAKGVDARNELIRSWRMMDVLGQVLRNKYGSFSKSKLREVVGSISEAGLRLAKVFVTEERIVSLENFFMKKARDSSLARDEREMIEYLRRHVRLIVVLLILGVLEHIGACVRKPELDEIVRDVCELGGTPAYELIGFGFAINAANELTAIEAAQFEELLRRFGRDRNAVAERLLTMSLEKYLSTHQVEYGVRQRLYRKLGLGYSANPRRF